MESVSLTGDLHEGGGKGQNNLQRHRQGTRRLWALFSSFSPFSSFTSFSSIHSFSPSFSFSCNNVSFDGLFCFTSTLCASLRKYMQLLFLPATRLFLLFVLLFPLRSVLFLRRTCSCQCKYDLSSPSSPIYRCHCIGRTLPLFLARVRKKRERQKEQSNQLFVNFNTTLLPFY